MIGLYEIDDDYIDYLRNIDSKVLSTKQGHRVTQRKYVGVILNNANYNYFIPLSSYKSATHDFMYESKSFKKIGNMAVLRINNMIPVHYGVFHRIDFNMIADINYKNLLRNEYRILKTREREIRQDARIVYFLRLNEKNKDKSLYKICCDFKALENGADKWMTNSTQSIKILADSTP